MRAGTLRGVIALDGPSGTGKSTVARRLATALEAGYLDTGAMYRAVTLAVLRAGIDLADEAAITLAVAESRLGIGTDPANPGVLLDGEDVAVEIRGPEVTGSVSPVSAIADVRELLVAEQRRIIAATVEERGGIVVEGRDIGTTVAPDAEIKVYLTASEQARANRRYRQDNSSGRASSAEAALASVTDRDRIDSSRAVSPLRRAEDAVEVDTTELDARGVVAILLSLVDERGLVGSGTERGS
ncbi:(d)CMP kinase [Sciscionella marina]|uniref:(d)CMP kinase n=1 Tax=Sciscionella marina TaxID=508770 RepID=UPI00035D9676|nr:(d)CMP kinase [Sciscionella marina]